MTNSSKINLVISQPEFFNYRGEVTLRRVSWRILKRIRNRTVENFLANGGDKGALRYFEKRGIVEIA